MAASNKMICPKCGAEMNHHAEKVDYGAALEDTAAADADFGGILQEVHTCPGCGDTALRAASS